MNQQIEQTKVKAITAATAFRRDWESNKAQISKQLPTGVDPDRFMRTVITTVTADPGLLEADRSSLFTACMLAAKDGLLPDGREATIQVYSTKIKVENGPDQWVKMAQYMPMVRGLIKSMYEAGCTKVEGYAVYEKDHFVFMLGDDPKIEHGPYMGADDRGEVIAAYAIVKLENGEIKREVMARKDIDNVREASKASAGPGWTTWYDQFAIKAVLKRIYKQVPGRSDEFEKIMDADNAMLGITFEGKGDTIEIIPEVTAMELVEETLGPEQSRADKLKETLTANKKSAATKTIETTSREVVSGDIDLTPPTDEDVVDAKSETGIASLGEGRVTPDGEIISGDNDPQKNNLDKPKVEDIPGVSRGTSNIKSKKPRAPKPLKGGGDEG